MTEKVPPNWLPQPACPDRLESWAVCLWSSVCLPVCPRHLIAKVLIPVQPQWSWWAQEDWLLTPFTGWGVEAARC